MQAVQFNVRLSAETIATIASIAAALECSQADVIRQAVRLLAHREKVPSAVQKKSGKKAENAIDSV